MHDIYIWLENGISTGIKTMWPNTSQLLYIKILEEAAMTLKILLIPYARGWKQCVSNNKAAMSEKKKILKWDKKKKKK